MGYITENLASEVAELLEGAVQDPVDVVAPSIDFLEGLPDNESESLNVLLELAETGGFPELHEFYPTFGEDISAFANIDEGVYAMGNDYAGNYWVLYPDGDIDCWCHDEGGYMEGHEFESIDDFMECLVLSSAVKEQLLDWETTRERFELRAEKWSGWEWFLENVDEFVEDL